MKTKNVSPEAYIAIGKDRQKVYGENTVYLENKKEFEFEFYNPTTFNVRANIYINGNPISNRGLVLRPGVRGWLDRYIDESRKFLFETYVVEGGSAEVRKAIANNGDIKIEFFKEKIAPPKPSYNYLSQCSTRGASSLFRADIEYDCSGGQASMDCLEDNFSSKSIDHAPEELSRGIVRSASCKMSKKIETGRVEKGGRSDQDFTLVDMDFEYFPFHTVEYKLMPLSQKPAEFGELKLKCKTCGTKIKSNWKVCPICGNPIENDCKCSHCGTKIEPAWKLCPICGESIEAIEGFNC